MSQYKDTSLKDLLHSFIDSRNEWVESGDNLASETHAETEMQEIAGELNRRFYVTQQQNQALLETLDALIEYFGNVHYADYSNQDEESLAEDLEQIKNKLQGEQA